MNVAVLARRVGFGMLVTISAIQPNVEAQGPRPPRGFRPPPPRPPVIVNNYSNNGSGLAAGAVGFGIGMLAGAVTSPRPAPSTVVVAPPASSVVVAQSRPQVVVTQPAPSVIVSRPAPPPDALTEALKMLNGRSYKTRRDGAMLLGRIKSPAAVGPLMDRLRNDKSDAVRKAAAWALAEIGDTSALDYLEKAAQFDESVEVRAAARTAQQRLLSRIAIATPAPLIEPQTVVRPIDSTPVPPPPPLPGNSPVTSADVPTTYSVPRASAAPPATSSNAAPPRSTSPFFNPPPAPSQAEPALNLSPPVMPLEVP